jgi:hypothetical protein
MPYALGAMQVIELLLSARTEQRGGHAGVRYHERYRQVGHAPPDNPAAVRDRTDPRPLQNPMASRSSRTVLRPG